MYTVNIRAANGVKTGVTAPLLCLQNNRFNTQWYTYTCSGSKRGQCHTATGVCIANTADARLACLDATKQWLCSALKIIQGRE